jgi:hypothetical protein
MGRVWGDQDINVSDGLLRTAEGNNRKRSRAVSIRLYLVLGSVFTVAHKN